MHRHYCSLWDKNYCAKGLSLHASLLKHSSEPFTLHILALDEQTWKILYDLQLENVELMWMAHFERALHMEPVKASRSKVEYFWTLASQLCEYLLPWMDEDGITYLDSDVFLYADPAVIFDEIGERSIAIVPHRFNERDRARLGANGEFNVGIVSFKNTDTGRRCLAKWAKQTREWCFARAENGKFGDQAYLNEFEQDFGSEVCVIKNLGVNLGPWSVGNFAITKRGDSVFVNDDELVAFHFHEYVDAVRLTYWPLRPEDKRLIYAPYIQAWTEATARIVKMEQAMEERAKEMLELPIG